MVMPGDNVEMMCEMYNPIAIENGQRFNIREGGRTVGHTSEAFRNRHGGAVLTLNSPQVATGLVTRILK